MPKIRIKPIKPALIAFSIAAALALQPLQARPSVKQFNKNQEAIFEFVADDMEYDNSIIIGKGHAAVINLD